MTRPNGAVLWEIVDGAFMNQANYYIGLLDWLIGPMADVQPLIGTLDSSIEIENSGMLNLRGRNGVLGTVPLAMLTWPKNLKGSIIIIDERCTVHIAGQPLTKHSCLIYQIKMTTMLT